MRQVIDMTGWKMWEHGVPDSRLVVIEKYGHTKDGHISWLCECSCEEHNRIIAGGKEIRSGNTKSCGCIRKEVARESIENVRHLAAQGASEKNKKYNEYKLNLEDEHGVYGVGYCHNTGKEFYFDMDDYDKIKDICWNEQFKHLPILQGRDLTTNQMIRMHALLGYSEYDHADRNELNNRKYNLRPATKQENARNHSVARNNTTGFIGVRWDKKMSKWASYIGIDKKQVYLGSFSKKEDAIVARLNAESKYFKEFAPQRHLFEEYGIISDNEGD